MEMNYIIGTGFFGHGEFKARFAQTWLENTRKFTSPKTIVCISCGGCPHPYDDSVQKIELSGNLGYYRWDQPYHHCGWSGSVMALAMIAYCNGSDFIYKEQDCLAFGPWVKTMYEDMGDKKAIFGRIPDWYSAQSVFLIKHDFIPWFVRDYLMSGGEACQMPEVKFAHLLRDNPDRYSTFTFGYDRKRPVNYSDSVFYIQQVTEEEFIHMKELKLI